MQAWAVSVGYDILGARAAAGFPSTVASPLVAAVHRRYHLLLIGTSRYIDNAAFITVDVAATTAAAAAAAAVAATAQIVHISIIHESTKSHDTSKRNKGASRQCCRPMRGIVGLLPF